MHKQMETYSPDLDKFAVSINKSSSPVEDPSELVSPSKGPLVKARPEELFLALVEWWLLLPSPNSVSAPNSMDGSRLVKETSMSWSTTSTTGRNCTLLRSRRVVTLLLLLVLLLLVLASLD